MNAMTGQENGPGPESADEFRRAKRGRNLAVLGVIIAFCALFYLITIVRMF